MVECAREKHEWTGPNDLSLIFGLCTPFFVCFRFFLDSATVMIKVSGKRNLFIYLFIYYTVYTHVKSFTIVKNLCFVCGENRRRSSLRQHSCSVLGRGYGGNEVQD